MFDQRKYRLAFDFLTEVQAFIDAVKKDDCASAAHIAEDGIFVQGSALYGEGFAPIFEDELKRLGCNESVADRCPLVVSSFFRALAVFAATGKAAGL